MASTQQPMPVTFKVSAKLNLQAHDGDESLSASPQINRTLNATNFVDLSGRAAFVPAFKPKH